MIMEVNLTVLLRLLVTALSVVIFLSWTVCGLDNGLALTPPMGWLSWGKFRCKTDCRKDPRNCLSEKLFQEMADTLISDGYKAAGYEYINIDDCWMSRMRDREQRLFPDPQRFPNGIQGIANYVHDRGLKLGIYNTFGKTTCMGFPGSQGFLELDAKTFAEWQVDMLKMDGCFTPTHLIPDGYMDMHRFLNATGRHILYSCSWPFYLRADGKHPNYNHIAKYCNIWRNSMDIEDSWESVLKIIDDFAAHQDAHIPAAGPGHFHDPDMLVVGGSGLDLAQSQTQFALWAILAAPLLMGNDLRSVKPEFRDVLLNTDVIAVNQDPLGRMGQKIFTDSVRRVEGWKRELTNEKYAIVYFNRNTKEETLYKTSLTAMRLPRNHTYDLRDLFLKKHFGHFKVEEEFKISIPPNGVRMFKTSSCSLPKNFVHDGL
ncbi:alpha-N-acetylgalactosaminidase-like [Anneissia japonica]|uniref:alpha-N-acetylgalactosaminidase-like n=1 Tax=Anneissia japonica TaxID=1529436 RepID=UPI0014256669|nr:alpha-N-acetylgalactosaminidase-like [Anneissia japonica]